MADQFALQDQNQVFSLLVASGTADTADTIRVLGDSITGGMVVATSGKSYSIRIDAGTVAGTTYLGKANPGSSEGSAVWQIKRLVEVSGTTTVIYADGDANFDNVWTGHGTLSYS